MKKICIVATVSSTIKSFYIGTAEYLHKEGGYDVSIICSPDEIFEASLPEFIHFYPITMERGISIGGIKAMMQMQRIFKREMFELVQYSTPNAAFYASIAASLAGIKKRLYHLLGFRYLGASGFGKTILQLIEKTACLLSTQILCVSRSNLELGVQEHIFSAKKASLIWNGSASGVDMNRFDITKKTMWRNQLREEFHFNDTDCVFCFAGRITGDKGINELLTAFFEMQQENKRLLLVGILEEEDTLEPQLLDIARSSDKVVFHSFVPDIERYYAASDILVLPSYREGFGNIVIEAEAMGLPVIVSNIPGPTEAMSDGVTGLIVEVKNSKSLMQAMIELCENEHYRISMGENSREFVKEKFDQKQLHQKTLESLNQIIES